MLVMWIVEGSWEKRKTYCELALWSAELVEVLVLAAQNDLVSVHGRAVRILMVRSENLFSLYSDWASMAVRICRMRKVVSLSGI